MMSPAAATNARGALGGRCAAYDFPHRARSAITAGAAGIIARRAPRIDFFA